MKVRKSNRNKSKRRTLTPEGKNQIRRSLMKRFGRAVAKQLLEDLGAEGAAPLAAAKPAAGEGSVEALISLIRSVLENPNITAEESIKQVSKRLKALKDMIPGGSSKDLAAATVPEGAPEDDDEEDDEDDEDKSRLEADDEDDEEIGKLPKRLQKLMLKMEAREERESVAELCESLGFKPTEKQRKLLLKTVDDEAREDLIESWQDGDGSFRRKPAGGRAKAADLLEANGGKKKEYKTAKEFAAGLKG